MDSQLALTAVTPPSSPEAEALLPVTASVVAPNCACGSQDSAPIFPVVGDRIEDCRLLVNLGSGASGKAFLAQQEALADRPLVLKFTPADSRDEHMKLARLQHTNIMPLYWVSTLPALGLRVLAMPYLGGINLAGLLKRLKQLPRAAWNGEGVFKILHDTQAELPMQITVQEQPVTMLKKSSWVQFVLRLGQTLAEALAYSHQRNVLHLDLKPANILITPDGQPILLDLDMARPPIPAGVTLNSWLGGSLAFASPEQFAAMKARSQQQPTPKAVDGRSDLYSLGLVLFDVLGGQREPRQRPDLNALRRVNPDVSQGLADILRRCLAEDSSERYRDGFALAEDLRRQLHDLPLSGVSNTWPERWQKWRRRRPLGLSLMLLLAGIVSTVGAVGIHYYQLNEDRRRQATTALEEGQELQRKGQHEAAVFRLLAGKELAEQAFGADVVRTQLARSLRMAERLQKAAELNKVIHLLRFYAFQEHTPRRMQYVLEGAGGKLWADRHLLTDQSAGKLEMAAENNIRTQLQELATLWSDWRVRLAPPKQAASIQADVRKVLAEAEQMFGPSLGLSLAQEQHSDGRRSLMPPEAAWEFCALGRMALAQGKHDDAARFIQQAIDKEPLGFVPHFYFGICALSQKHYEQALQSFSFCVGRDPCEECFLLRGQAYAALGETDRALRDFDHAIEKNPSLAIAYQHRGNLFRQLGRSVEADIDLEISRKLND